MHYRSKGGHKSDLFESRNEKSRLDVWLATTRIVPSRSKAQIVIEAGLVTVNGEPKNDPSYLVSLEDDIVLKKVKIPVSRAYFKLEHAVTAFGIEVSGKNCLDIGSSTGGFTQCLLDYGASKVVCVEVGTNQFDPSLYEKNKSRVELHESTDIRLFSSRTSFDLIVVDVSFISLRYIIDDIRRLSRDGHTAFIALVKPQFEVGKGNTKKGIVVDESLRKQSLKTVQNAFMDAGARDSLVSVISPIQGGDGNVEYLLYGKF